MIQGFVQIFLTLFLVVVSVPILGHYLAEVFFMHKTWLDPVMNPLERLIYLLIDIEPQKSMTGRKYAIAILLSNTAMAILAFLLLMFQSLLPLNPTDLGMPTWDTALHTTISFLVAADLQHYLPETTMSYLSQITALGFLMFVAPATGLAVGIAFIRGLTGRPLGNFYVDLTRSMTRVLLPLAFVSTVLLMLGGVPETLTAPVNLTTLEGATQAIARGPIAHFESIKMLGENGGAFFGGNSAHPFESGLNLERIDLRSANLQGANLKNANLRYANLQWADIREANLQEADLTGAILKNTLLTDANLQKANLSASNLEGTDFRNTNLSYANLIKASKNNDIQDRNSIILCKTVLQNGIISGRCNQPANSQSGFSSGVN